MADIEKNPKGKNGQDRAVAFNKLWLDTYYYLGLSYAHKGDKTSALKQATDLRHIGRDDYADLLEDEINSIIGEENLIPQEIKWGGRTYVYDPYWKEYESLKYGDFDGDGEDEIVVSFMGQIKDSISHISFYLIYDVVDGRTQLVKEIVGREYLGEVRLIDLEKDGQKEIAIFSGGGAHSTSIYIYKYENGLYECIFKNGSACLVETDFEADRPIIKVGRAKWGTKVLTESGEEINWSYASGLHGDSLWQVYIWNGKEFIYDEKLSTTPEISEKEEAQRYVDKVTSLLEKKE